MAEIPPQAVQAARPCRWFRWIGQPWTSCDACGRPAWEHDGELIPGDEDPLGDMVGRPWVAGEAMAMRGLFGSPGDPAGERSDVDAPARGCTTPESDATPGPRVIGTPDPFSEPPEGRTALRDRYAEALAAKFTEPTYRYDRKTDAETVIGQRPADRVDHQMRTSFMAGDGCRSFTGVTCADAAEVCAAVRDDELAALRREVAYVTETGEQWRLLCEEVKQDRSDALVCAEQAEAALARVRGRLDALIADGFGATTPTLREVLAALDVPADGEQTPTPATPEESHDA